MATRETLAKLGNVVGATLLIVLVATFIIFAVPEIIGANASHVVLSGSMEPTISPGDVVIVNDVDPSNIQEGDIITFATQGSDVPTTHRVIEVITSGDEVKFRTMGDANEDPDAQPVAASSVQGRVMFTIPYIGHVIGFASRPMGMVLFMVVPLALLIITEVWSFATDTGTTSQGSESLSSSDSDSSSAGTQVEAQGESAHMQEVAPSDEAVEAGSQEEDTYTITRTDLQFTLIVMGVFVLYALWILYQRWFVMAQREPVSISIAIATTASWLLLIAAYVGSPSGEGESTSPTSRPGGSGGAIRDPPSPEIPADTDHEAQRADSIVEIIDESVASQAPIIWQPWNGLFRVESSTESYVYASERESVPSQATDARQAGVAASEAETESNEDLAERESDSTEAEAGPIKEGDGESSGPDQAAADGAEIRPDANRGGGDD